MKKLLVGVQARSNSTRYPGKIYADLGGLTVLENCYLRCYQAPIPEGIDQVEVKVLMPEGDTRLKDFCEEKCLAYAQGHPTDLVRRYMEVLCTYDACIRITSDCPVIEPFWITKCMEGLLTHDYVTNVAIRTVVDGYDVQGATQAAWVWLDLFQKEEREHPFYFLDRDEATQKKFTQLYKMNCLIDSSRVILNPYAPENKLSIDLEEDLERCKRWLEKARKQLENA